VIILDFTFSRGVFSGNVFREGTILFCDYSLSCFAAAIFVWGIILFFALFQYHFVDLDLLQ